MAKKKVARKAGGLIEIDGLLEVNEKDTLYPVWLNPREITHITPDTAETGTNKAHIHFTSGQSLKCNLKADALVRKLGLDKSP